MEKCGPIARGESDRLVEGELPNNPNVGTGHILLGLLSTNSIAKQALTDFGIRLPLVRAAVKDLMRDARFAVTGDLPFSANADYVLNFAAQSISSSLDSCNIAAEHLLLALLQQETSTALRVLELFKVEKEDMRKL